MVLPLESHDSTIHGGDSTSLFRAPPGSLLLLHGDDCCAAVSPSKLKTPIPHSRTPVCSAMLVVLHFDIDISLRRRCQKLTTFFRRPHSSSACLSRFLSSATPSSRGLPCPGKIRPLRFASPAMQHFGGKAEISGTGRISPYNGSRART
jgi:hypothetical protein